jgi:hypothetical protein
MGYNTWNDFRCDCISAANVMSVADAMAAMNLTSFGYEVRFAVLARCQRLSILHSLYFLRSTSISVRMCDECGAVARAQCKAFPFEQQEQRTMPARLKLLSFFPLHTLNCMIRLAARPRRPLALACER